MPIVEDLRAIANRANQELSRVQDFFEHSKLVWQTFQDFVNAGHSLSFESSTTGTTTDAAGLLALAPLYTRRYLAAFTFRQFVSVFESFFFEFFERVLRHNPWQFGQTQLDFNTVLKAHDRDEIIGTVLAKQLNEVKYENVREWFAALNKSVKLGCPADDEIDALAELKTTRDVLEHNGGIVNDTYVRKAGKKARFAAGELIEIDDDYHLACWRLLRKLVADLTTVAGEKLAPS